LKRIQLLVLSCFCVLSLSSLACSDTIIDPFENDEQYFTVWGYLDQLSSNHSVRVIPVTRFPEKFRLQSLEAPPWFTEPDTYLEVDTREDLELIRAIVGHFQAKGQAHFGLGEILAMLRENTSLAAANVNVERRWKSLREK